jgi:hypothetical protein
MSAVSIALKIGIVLQNMIQQNEGSSEATLFLSMSSVIFVFYIFAIIFTYPMYKEARAQTTESMNGLNRPLSSMPVSNNQDQERPNANRQAGFVPFSGRGHAVG